MDFQTAFYIVMSIAAIIGIMVFGFFVIILWRIYIGTRRLNRRLTETLDKSAEYAYETKESLGRMITTIIDYFTYKLIRRRRR